MIEIPERVKLAEASAMYSSDVWKEHMERMRYLVEEAQEAMIGNMSSDPQISYHLNLRWQQREVMYRASMIIAEDTIKAHEEELKQFQTDFEQLSREA